MLSILIADQPLDLSEDFSVSLNLKSPLFNDVGDYSFPFKVPTTARNMSILGWKNRIASIASIYETHEGSFRWNGIVLYSGQIRIKSAGEKNFEGILYVNKGNFNYEIKNLMLNSIDLGVKEFTSDNQAMDYFNWSLTRFYPEVDFSMPQITNLDFFDPPANTPELNAYNVIFPDGKLHKTTSDGTKRTILIPFLYLKYVLNKLAENFGYRLEDKFFTSCPELSRLVIYHSVNLNEVLFGLQQLYYSRFVPKVKVSEFIAGLEKWFNCSFHVDSRQRVIRIVSNRDVLLRSELVNFSGNILSISQEIPDEITGYRFLLGPDSGDKVYQAQLDAEKGITDYIRGAVSTFSEIPPYPFTWLGDIYYVVDTNSWWQFSVNGITFLAEWQQLPNGPSLTDKFFYKWGDDKNKYETIFSSLSDNFGVVSCGNPGTDKDKITPRLFWVGMTGGYGTPSQLRGLANDSVFSLRYPGANGIFNLYWKDWVDWIMTTRKSVKIEKQMDFIELKNLDFTSRYRVNGINYLVSEVSVTLTKSSIKSAQLKCFTCP
ncbi:MAG: hypothetical protein PHP04_09605 [Bacteroidales bacterium]|nr:hypothetical protein [Bacteroidales bacterium]